MTRARLALGAAAVAVLAAGAYLVLGRSAGETTAAADVSPATTTAEVTRRDLAETDAFEGTLGYASSRSVVNQLPGTITALAAEGSVVRRGQALYRVDGLRVALMYGAVPAYRPLFGGVEDGRDVRQLEWNLVALGYDPERSITIDNEFTSATTDAVLRWQEDIGAPEDGGVALGEVVFLPGRQRIGEHTTSVGLPAQTGVEVMTTASTTQVVTLDLDATRQELVDEGDAVEVELPDGREVTGTVASVGKVAESEAADDGSAGEPTIEVTISLPGEAATDLDQAPVDVRITRELQEDVLAAPVTALLALAGGGYGVELSTDAGPQLVAVETGAYADGYVEVRGEGIDEGVLVVVPE